MSAPAPFARQSVADDACCHYCCATPVSIEFDGEKFCQACADKWVRGQAPDDDLVPISKLRAMGALPVKGFEA